MGRKEGGRQEELVHPVSALVVSALAQVFATYQGPGLLVLPDPGALVIASPCCHSCTGAECRVLFPVLDPGHSV